MAAGSAGNGLAKTVSVAFQMFSQARQAIARVFTPGLDLYPDGLCTLEDITVTAAAPNVSAGQQAKFICDGYLVGVLCSVQSGTAADLSTTKIAIVINGSTSIFQTGQQGTGYVSFQALQAAMNGGGGWRILAPIRQSVPYQVFIKYEGAQTSVTADVALAYVNTSSPPLTD